MVGHTQQGHFKTDYVILPHFPGLLDSLIFFRFSIWGDDLERQIGQLASVTELETCLEQLRNEMRPVNILDCMLQRLPALHCSLKVPEQDPEKFFHFTFF